jgi:hypothetical protein
MCEWCVRLLFFLNCIWKNVIVIESSNLEVSEKWFASAITGSFELNSAIVLPISFHFDD